MFVFHKTFFRKRFSDSNCFLVNLGSCQISRLLFKTTFCCADFENHHRKSFRCKFRKGNLKFSEPYLYNKCDVLELQHKFVSNLYRHYAHVPLLSLSNMLHKLHFINDSLSVALTGISMNPDNFLLAYYLGNIYVVSSIFNFFIEF